MKVVKIVILEDDIYQNKALTRYVQTICSSKVYPNCKFDVKTYTNAHDCIRELEDDITFMLIDYYLINMEEDDVLTGGDVVDIVKICSPKCEIIMVSSQEDNAVKRTLINKGVKEYVDKNLNSINRVGAVLQDLISRKISIA